MNTAINREFRSLFKEVEKKHIDFRKRLNALTETEEVLEEILSKEMIDFEAWRFPVMDRLGEITYEFDPSQKAEHQNYIRKSKYYEIVQEAPFY